MTSPALLAGASNAEAMAKAPQGISQNITRADNSTTISTNTVISPQIQIQGLHQAAANTTTSTHNYGLAKNYLEIFKQDPREIRILKVRDSEVAKQNLMLDKFKTQLAKTVQEMETTKNQEQAAAIKLKIGNLVKQLFQEERNNIINFVSEMETIIDYKSIRK